MAFSRRDFCVALPALAGLSALGADEKPTLPSKVYEFDQLPVHQAATVISRAILAGGLYEGCQISLHESDLAPYSAPHPPHHHRHEEMVLVVEGTLEFTIHGNATRAGAGSVLFAGSNDEHGIRNPTAERAKYFVLALGPGKT